MKRLRAMVDSFRFTYTTIGVLLVVLALVLAWTGKLDILGVNLLALIQRIEHNEVDELIVAAMFFTGGIAVDVLRARRRRSKALFRATMRTVHGIMNNFLRSLEVVRSDADARLPIQLLAQLDDMTRLVSTKLQELSDIVDPRMVTTEGSEKIFHGKRKG